MTKPSDMTLSQCVTLCVGKGWGQGDQSKMMGFFSINRRMADKLAETCEDEYVQRAREHKRAVLELAKAEGKAPHNAHQKPVRSR